MTTGGIAKERMAEMLGSQNKTENQSAAGDGNPALAGTAAGGQDGPPASVSDPNKTSGVGNNGSGESVNPPGVKRGWDSQMSDFLGIHWLRGSVHKSKFDDLVHELDHYFGSHELRDYGYWVYNRSVFWSNGSVALNYFGDNSESGGNLGHGASAKTKDMITFEIPGQALDKLDSKQLRYLLHAMDILEATIGRIDVYFDDMARTITPRKLYNLVYDEDEDGKAVRYDFTGFKRISFNGIGGHSGRKYDCVSFGCRGSKGSGAFYRCYDKNLESNGENKGIRHELELSGKKASAAFKAFRDNIENPECLAKIAGALIGGSIDFIKRESGDKNLSRCEQYEFWSEILEKIGRAKFELRYSQPTIDKTRDYISTQTANANRALYKAWGPEKFFDWFMQLVTDDHKELPAKYKQAIYEYEHMRDSEREFELVKIKNIFKGHDCEISFEADFWENLEDEV